VAVVQANLCKCNAERRSAVDRNGEPVWVNLDCVEQLLDQRSPFPLRWSGLAQVEVD
jgi:hypothetical protein